MTIVMFIYFQVSEPEVPKKEELQIKSEEPSKVKKMDEDDDDDDDSDEDVRCISIFYLRMICTCTFAHFINDSAYSLLI